MDIFSCIKKNVSIEAVVSEYTTLKRFGNYFKARCPLHQEKTASFTITPGKEIFYCFGCHQGGDVIMFVSQLERCSQKDAALLLAERYSVVLPENHHSYEVSREQKERYFFIHEKTAQFFVQQYMKSSDAKQYVASRGIAYDSVKRFSIGFFPSNKNSIHELISYAHKNSILTKELVDIHLILPAESFYYSSFEGRLIIPITDTLGRISGFGGRTLHEADTRAKYYNSHENEFFSKGMTLFGLSQAKEHIREKKSVFVVEGYMDCIIMAQYGYQNTVATLGTACTESHLKQLARYSDTLYIVYDGDEAGKNALFRISEKCWRVNIEPIILKLPKNEDPASYLVKYKTLEPIFSTKQDIFSFCITSHATTMTEKTLQEKLASIQSILSILSLVDDPIKQELLIIQASKVLEIDHHTLKQELKKIEKKQIDRAVIKKLEAVQPLVNQESIQDEFSQRILGAMLHTITLLDPFVIELFQFSDDQEIRLIAQKINVCMKNNKDMSYNFDTFWNHFSESERHIVSRMIMQIGTTVDVVVFKSLVSQFSRQMFKKAVNCFKVQLAQAMQENNREKTESVLQQLVIMQKKIKRETSAS